MLYIKLPLQFLNHAQLCASTSRVDFNLLLRSADWFSVDHFDYFWRRRAVLLVAVCDVLGREEHHGASTDRRFS